MKALYAQNVMCAQCLVKIHARLFSNCHYKVLDVPKTASQDQIKTAFFEKSKKYHPDVSPDNATHHKLFVKLNNAYSILSNTSKRRDYDRSLLKNTNIYHNTRYSDTNTSYYGGHSRASPPVSSINTTRSENLRIALGVVFLACVGATARFAWIWVNVEEYRSKNITVAFGVLAYMFVGATLCFIVIWYKHRQYKKQLDIHSMEASRLYKEARERSSKNGLKRQLEILVEKQRKNEVKTDTNR